MLVLGLEPEDSVQYALPVKFMNYESVQYQKNLHKIKNAHRKNRDLSREEFISGFSRTDKLQPVITLGIYMGKKKWDAPENLHGLLDWGVFPQKIRKQLMRCCNDFHVNMLDVNKLSSSEVFCSDLREVFGFLMRQNDKKALREFVQENEEFRHLKEDAYDVIAAFSNTRELRIAKETYRTEGGMDMCLAIQEMIQDGIDEGMEKGINRINILISRLAEDGRTEDLVRSARDADYQKKLLKEYHI